MAALYLPDADFGLSSAAAALSETLLNIQALQAEAVLNLAGTSYTDDSELLVKRAVALQVNLQVRSEDESDVVSESRGRQSVKYATYLGRRVQIDPNALEIVERLRGSLPPGSGSSTAQVVF